MLYCGQSLSVVPELSELAEVEVVSAEGEGDVHIRLGTDDVDDDDVAGDASQPRPCGKRRSAMRGIGMAETILSDMIHNLMYQEHMTFMDNVED